MTTATAQAEDATRPLGPHVHGAGQLAIAIEGETVSIELDAPAADILGFEHQARTPAEKATATVAEARLAKPLELFALPAAAQCTLVSAKVERETAAHEAGSGSGKAAAYGDSPANGTASAHEDGHADYAAAYTLACKHPQAITVIEFHYFQAFSRAQRLTVTIVGPKGQSQGTVTRDKPRLDLSGLM